MPHFLPKPVIEHEISGRTFLYFFGLGGEVTMLARLIQLSFLLIKFLELFYEISSGVHLGCYLVVFVISISF